METEASAFDAEEAATALLQMKYSNWPTVEIDRSRKTISVANVSTTTALSYNVAETQAGSNTGYEKEESDETASEGIVCGPEKHAEGEETCFMSDNEKSVLKRLVTVLKLTRQERHSSPNQEGGVSGFDGRKKVASTALNGAFSDDVQRCIRDYNYLPACRDMQLPDTLSPPPLPPLHPQLLSNLPSPPPSIKSPHDSTESILDIRE